MDLSLSNPWVVGGGVVGLGIVAYYLYNNYGTQSTDTTTSGAGGVTTGGAAVAVPTSLGSDSTGLGTNSSDALNALTTAINQLNAGNQPSDAVQLAQINANQLAHQEDVGSSIFQTLTKSLNAHVGLGKISASIPGLGTVSTFYGKPTKTVTKTVIQKVPIKTVGAKGKKK